MIVGSAVLPGGNLQHAFVWDSGRLVDAGSLPGLENSSFGCINSAGVAVGIAFDASDSVRRGVVWGAGRLFDLNDLVLPTPYRIDSATCIDESGRIAASGVRGDLTMRTLLLTPL